MRQLAKEWVNESGLLPLHIIKRIPINHTSRVRRQREDINASDCVFTLNRLKCSPDDPYHLVVPVTLVTN